MQLDIIFLLTIIGIIISYLVIKRYLKLKISKIIFLKITLARTASKIIIGVIAGLLIGLTINFFQNSVWIIGVITTIVCLGAISSNLFVYSKILNRFANAKTEFKKIVKSVMLETILFLVIILIFYFFYYLLI